MLQRSILTPSGDHLQGETPVREPDDGQSEFSLLEVLNFLRREWKLIAIAAAAGLLVGTMSLFAEVPRYTASAQLLLDPHGDQPPSVTNNNAQSSNNLDLSSIENQIAIMRSSILLKRVVERERLFDDAEFGSAPQRQDQSRKPAEWEVVSSTERLKGAVSVNRAGQADVLWVSVTSVDPARAARLANAVAEAYVVDRLDARYEAAKKASAWLADRLEELRKQLRDSEEALAKFRGEHGLAGGNGNVTLGEQQLTDLKTRLVAVREEIAEKQSRLNLLASLKGQANLQNLPPDLATAGILQSLRQRDAELSQKEADLASRYTGQHPLLVNVRAERQDVRRAIAAEIGRLIAGIKSEVDLAKARQAAIEKSFSGVTGEVTADSATAIRLRELERTAAVNKSLYDDFLQKSKVVESQSTFEVKEARVISPALPPGIPSSPKKVQRLLMSLIIGLMLGAGGAFAWEKLNTGFTTPQQVGKALNLPLLASVSQTRPNEYEVAGRALPLFLVPHLKPLSRHSEMLRALRLGIRSTDIDEPPTVIQLTSAVPGEGKTTLALALAASAAAAGMKVLFIDADLRHPIASQLLGFRNRPGLVDLLVAQPNVQEVIQYHDQAKMWVLPVGNADNCPSDLLASERMRSFMAKFKQTFDYVVIDTSPLCAVVDPAVTAGLADKVVVVVRWGATSRNLVKDAIGLLSPHRNVAGVVFNMVDDQLAQKYGTYLSAKAGGHYDGYYSG